MLMPTLGQYVFCPLVIIHLNKLMRKKPAKTYSNDYLQVSPPEPGNLKLHLTRKNFWPKVVQTKDWTKKKNIK